MSPTPDPSTATTHTQTFLAVDRNLNKPPISRSPRQSVGWVGTLRAPGEPSRSHVQQHRPPPTSRKYG